MTAIEPVLVLAVTESGRGNHLYPAISDYILASKGRIEASENSSGNSKNGSDDDSTTAAISSSRSRYCWVAGMPHAARTITSIAAASHGSYQVHCRTLV